MRNIVIDINIFVDFLFKRTGHEKAAEIFKHCIKSNVNGFVCAHEITTLFYFLNKSSQSKGKVKKTLSGIMKRFKVIEVNERILQKALYSQIDDYEDAVIEISASENNAAFIITRNIKDFKKSAVKAVTPDEMLALIKSNVDTKNNV